MNKMIWPTMEEVEQATSKGELVAMGLCAWANCYMEKPPEDFGMMMVKIGDKLGIIPSQENLSNLGKEILGGND